MFCMVMLSFAQDRSTSSSKHIEYNNNVNQPLTSVELNMIREVYKDYSNSDVLSRPQRLRSVKNVLRNRIKIFKENSKDLSKLTKLSKVPLFSAYNNNLKRDIIFNPKTFNPLKYQFDFYSNQSTKHYRVDNTNYIITVFAQHK